VGELLPDVLAEVIDRAGHGNDRWAEQVAATGYCAHPVRLRGRVEQADPATGELREVYTTQREPDATLLKACGNRRAAVCPSCSATYQADSFQLLAAGLRGGKGVPDTVAAHPRLFVTFTPRASAACTAGGRRAGWCGPATPTGRARRVRMAGGRAAGTATTLTTQAGRAAVPVLLPGRRAGAVERPGGAAVVADDHLPVPRLAQLAGLSEGELRRLVRVSFAKVAEYQRRGAVHFHAVLRLDAATACRCPACLAPPPAGFTAELLEAAVRRAAASVTVPCPSLDDDQGVTLTAGWGEQLDVRNITKGDGEAGELSAEQVAGYVAKYASKATEALGVTLDRRVTADDLDGLALPAHVAELVRACLELGARAGLARLRLRAWAHMLGFGGHFSTKSRRYSTTLGALRRARVAYAIRRRRGKAIPLDAWGRPEDDQAAVVIATWRYLGSGYQSTGEAWLAAMAAARAREERRIAKEELRTTTIAA
jgi:hypothetical protein